MRQKSKSSGLSTSCSCLPSFPFRPSVIQGATLKGKGPVRKSAKSKGKQRQRTEEEIDPDDDDIDTNVSEGMNKFLEALHDHLFRLAGPDPTLSIESNPPQFSEPQDLNSGVTVESGAMESGAYTVWLLRIQVCLMFIVFWQTVILPLQDSFKSGRV